MDLGVRWTLHGDGRTPAPGAVVRPDERLSWPRTAGLGAQHVVAMFGATFVFPLIMGLNPQLAIMMSGIATICFLLIVKNKVPSYLGTSASFVGGVVAIRAQGGDSSDVVGSILVSGVVLAIVGVIQLLQGQIVFGIILLTFVLQIVVGFLLGLVLAPLDDAVAALISNLISGIAIGPIVADFETISHLYRSIEDGLTGLAERMSHVNASEGRTSDGRNERTESFPLDGSVHHGVLTSQEQHVEPHNGG